MASEQAETNFRNTILTALPLLKNEQDKIQFLTEQFVAKLKDTEEDLFYFPVELIKMSERRDNSIRTYLDGKGGKELKTFLSEGKKINAQRYELADRAEKLKEAQESLYNKRNNPIKSMGIFNMCLLGGVAYLVISIPCFGLDNTIRFLAPGTPRILFFSSPLFGAVIRSFALLREIKLLKSKIAGLTNSKNGSTLTEESRELAKVVELHDKTWMTFRSQIAKSLVEEYKAIKSADARSLITESVEFRIKDGIRDFQSFLPPSVRLPASHFAPFLFTEEDVENFEVEQKDIANLLEEQLEPDYENETVVWA